VTDMSKAIMIQGTTSNAGKSLLAAGFCRIFRQDGYRVAPFKSQNMALNSFVTADGLEMGRAQVMQAECAGLPPDVRMNPVLLKPNSDTGSQVIVEGEVVGNMKAAAYFAYKKQLIPQILRAYRSLAAEVDIMVLEGAGSPVEINLKQDDIVNMGMAEMARSPVLLVADIGPGGVFASIAGTVQLLEPHERDLLKGVIINKFRGDPDILAPGLRQLEEIIRKPVLGVVPFMELDVDDEDSMSSRLDSPTNPTGLVDIAVIRLPRMSNFTDFAPLAGVDGVGVRYVGGVSQLGSPDLIILPGTKSTMDDLLWLRQCGLEARIAAHVSAGKPLFGICGGYQMLGAVLHDPDCVERGGSMAGLGLLEQETTFSPEKRRAQVTGTVAEIGGVFAELSGASFTGYEIHMGQSRADNSATPLCRVEGSPSYPDGVVSGNVYGCYIHGFFDSPQIAEGVVRGLLREKGLDFSDVKAMDPLRHKEEQYDHLAATLRKSLDMQKIYAILEAGV